MRVGILANVPLDVNSGSGYVIRGYADQLSSRGHTVELITAYPTALSGLPRGKRFLTKFYMLKIFALIKRSDAVLVWGSESGWLSGLLSSGLFKIPIIACSNGLDTHVADQMGEVLSRKQHLLLSRSFRKLDGLILVSMFDQEYAIANSYQSTRSMLVLENPLPVDFLNRKISLDRGNIVLFVGSWISRKGIDAIIGSIGLVSEAVPDVLYRFIGRGTSSAYSEAKEYSVRIESIDPGVARQDLIDFYSEAAIILIPSKCESFGLTAAEAMACGCCVIGTDTGFVNGLLKGVEVVIVPFDDARSLASAVVGCLKDDNRRKSIAERGYAKVQGLCWNSLGDRLEKYLDEQIQVKRDRTSTGRL